MTVHELGIYVIASFPDLFGFQLLLTIILRNRRVARTNRKVLGPFIRRCSPS